MQSSNSSVLTQQFQFLIAFLIIIGMAFVYLKTGVTATIVGNSQELALYCEPGSNVIIQGQLRNFWAVGSVTIVGNINCNGSINFGALPPGINPINSQSMEVVNGATVYL